MCYGCWEEAGSPQIDSEVVRQLAPLIREGDRFGALHIVIEDWNLEDSHLDSCENEPCEPLTENDRAILHLMKQATEDERYSAMALADGFTTVPADIET